MAGARLFLLLLMLLASGCVPFRKDGTTHYLVLGFGVVSVNNTNQQQAVVQKAKVIGLYGSSGPGAKLGIGYTDAQTIEVNTNSNLVIEVDSVGKPIKINVPCAHLH